MPPNVPPVVHICPCWIWTFCPHACSGIIKWDWGPRTDPAGCIRTKGLVVFQRRSADRPMLLRPRTSRQGPIYADTPDIRRIFPSYDTVVTARICMDFGNFLDGITLDKIVQFGVVRFTHYYCFRQAIGRFTM